jgi:formylglycine-generating enzyme required for sulfatase activity
MAPDYLQRTGYRLATEAEWEYACRAGGETCDSFGESAKLLAKYGRYNPNPSETSHPVGSLKPNDLGLFDMLGNCWEWCQNANRPYGNNVVVDSEEENRSIYDNDARIMLSGSFANSAIFPHSDQYWLSKPTRHTVDNEFRVARTFIP